jgi:ribosome-associated protein
MSGQRDLSVRHDLVIRAGELREAASRSGGPGGQHVNKTSTRVTLRWSVTRSECLSATQRRRLLSRLASRLTRTGDLVVHCDRTRSRARNREFARERIAEIVSGALVRQTPRRATRPTKTSRVRRLDAKTRRGAIKRTRGAVGTDSD